MQSKEGPHRQADASRHAARAEWHLHQHFQSRRRPYISTLYDGGGSIKVIRSFQTTAGQMIMKL